MVHTKITIVYSSILFVMFLISDVKFIDKLSPFDKPTSNCQDLHLFSFFSQLRCEIKQKSSLSFSSPSADAYNLRGNLSLMMFFSTSKCRDGNKSPVLNGNVCLNPQNSHLSGNSFSVIKYLQHYILYADYLLSSTRIHSLGIPRTNVQALHITFSTHFHHLQS